MCRRVARRRCSLLALVAAFLAGCQVYEPQSALHPAGPAAEAIAWLWWGMFIAFTAVFGLVLVLLLIAIFRPRHEHQAPPLGRTGFVVAGGVVLPIVVLLPLLVWSLETSAALRRPDDALTVEVVGRMWWWEVRYPEQGIVTANEIHVPAGQPVKLELTSADVIHSFWAPSLHGKRDMIPGLTTTFWIQADRPGVYRGQCAEYCGLQHANMAFVVVALPPDEFAAWMSERSPPPVEPESPERKRGLAIFLRAGCAKCHTIRGTPAQGKLAPDLTHIGSRQTLAAGTLPNNRGNLAGWIANPQALKPGAKMPATYLPPEELFDLVSYLEGRQ